MGRSSSSNGPFVENKNIEIQSKSLIIAYNSTQDHDLIIIGIVDIADRRSKAVQWTKNLPDKTTEQRLYVKQGKLSMMFDSKRRINSNTSGLVQTLKWLESKVWVDMISK